MMRSACGSNDHPDSNVFIQMFRLISTYSLVKPPKGSNVEGSDMLSSLLNVDEIVSSEENTRKVRNMLDNILDNKIWFDNDIDISGDHNYNIMQTSRFVLSYISGYIARKASRFTKCENCLQSLRRSESHEEDELIKLLNKGFLIYPSARLFALTSALECSILDVLSATPVHHETLFEILAKIEEVSIPLVGCEEHKENFSTAIIRFFLVSRMHFICKQMNRIHKASKEKTKNFRKLAKL